MNEKLRQKMQQNETAYGLWVTSESTSVTEVAAMLGLDWICIDLEHGYLSYQQVAAHLAAARGSDLTILVRPPSHELEPTKRVLDLGAHGIILPLVQTVEELKQAQDNFYYPPKGQRGIGGERNVSWGLNLEEYVKKANEELLFIPMIETKQAVENFDEILACDGIEAIFLGPGDMSASYGYVGQWEGPGVAEINLELLEKAKAKNICTGIVARHTEEMLSRRDQGFGMVSLGSDIGLMIRQMRAMSEALGNQPIGHKWF